MTKRKTFFYHVARATMTLLVMLLTTATAWAIDGVPYLDPTAPVGQQSKTQDGVKVINNVTKPESLGESSAETWYVVEGTVSYSEVLLVSGNVHLILADNAQLIINSYDTGIYAETSCNLYIYAQSTGNNQGMISATGGYSMGIYVNNIDINGGIVNVYDSEYGIKTASNGIVNINGGTVNLSGYDGIDSSTVNITGGNVTATGTINNGINATNITINSGTVTATGYYGIYATDGNITITDGSVSAIGQGDYGIYAHDVTIEDGEINATGSEDGISAYNDITINGGSINATVNSGIHAGGNITITDGCVRAIGQREYGIYANYITIEDGEINATGYEDGIHASNDITINGGSVTINSQEGGDYPEAGIFADGVITLNGGTVISIGIDYGIGSNYYYGRIILAGATVTASGYSAPTVAIADDIKYNYDGIETPLEGELTDLDDIKGKKLTAIMPTKYEAAAKPVDGNYWSTFYFGSMGFTIDEGVDACAYTATYGLNNETNEYELTLNKLGKDIPQGTAVIIVSSTASVSLTKNDNLGTFSGSNSLRGVDVRTDMSTLGTGTFYVMGKKDNNFGFFKYTADYMPARKAFLLIDDSNEALARGISMVFDDATGIRSIDKAQIDTASDAWYSLDGRKLLVKPTTKGVYINNGNKVIIK